MHLLVFYISTELFLFLLLLLLGEEEKMGHTWCDSGAVTASVLKSDP